MSKKTIKSSSASVKSVSSYTRVDEMPILRPNDPANLALWLEAGEVYFKKTYNIHGKFFPSGIKPVVPMPVMPTVVTQRMAAKASEAAAAKAHNVLEMDSTASSVADDSESSSDDDEETEVIVTSDAIAEAVHTEAIKLRNKKIEREKELRPSMYADIRGNLSSESVNKLAEDDKYRRYHEEDNPYGMLRLILKTHGGARTGWTVTDKLDQKQSVFGIKQKDESMLQFKTRFLVVAKSSNEYTLQELAIIFIRNLSASNNLFQTDCEKLIATGKFDEYPATVEIAFMRASKYRNLPRATKETYGTTATTLFTTNSGGKKGGGGEKSNGGSTDRKLAKRGADKKPSGYSKKSGNDKTSGVAKFPCSTCCLLGKPDDHSHFPNNCPHKSEVQEIIELSKNKSATAMMATSGFDSIDLTDKKPRHTTRIMLGKHSDLIFSMVAKLKPGEIVLDNASTINLFGNRKMLSYCENTNKISVHGVGGDIDVHQKGVYANCFETYCSEEFDCNILSQPRVEDAIKSIPGASIEYDQDTGNFDLNVPGHGFWRFARRDDLGGLRVANGIPETAYISVAENRRKYSTRQLRDADNAREVIRRANFPSDKSMANLVNTGNILNSPITSSDVHRATEIDGGYIPSAMGKGTKQKPTVLSEEPAPDVVDKDVHLGCDIFFVDGHAFLLTVSNFGYGMAAYLGIEGTKGTRSANNIWKFLSLMFSSYVAYGFNLVSFSCDKEPGISASQTQIEAKGMVYCPKASDSKVPKVERRIRTIKERDRATRASMNFKLFGTMLIFSVLNNLRCINLFPCTASPNVAPREIFTGIRCDFRRDFNVAYGDYCLVYDTSISPMEKNSPKRRKEECIAMLPVGNKDGDVKFFSLKTGQIITRNNFKIYPMPDIVIDHINEMFKRSGAKEYSMTPIYRTPFHIIEDGDQDEFIEMETPETAVIPKHGRTPIDEQESETAIIEECLDQIAEPEPATIEECSDRIASPEPPDETPEDVQEQFSNSTEVLEETVIDEEPLSIPAAYTVPESGAVTPDIDDQSYPAEAVPGTDHPASRYPKRENRTTWKDRVYRMHVKQALKQYGRKGLVSMVKEIRNVAIDKAGMIPVNPNKLSKGELKSVISSSLFLKEKFNPDGSFEKLKARLVAGGHMQDRDLYTKDDISSPTVGTSSVMTVVAVAAKENRYVLTADIGGAYLNASMTKGKLILMRLSKENAAILVWLMPEYAAFMLPNGTMLVKLTKALYGCVESARLWYNHLSSHLISDGYTQNPIDICVFNKTMNDVQCTVCVHVDDLLFTSIDESIIEKSLECLIKVYKDVSVKRGKVQQYLGMLLDFSTHGKCFVTMPKFTEEIIIKGNVTGVAATPALESLFVVREDATPLCQEDAEHFHTMIAMCQYLAKRVRPDILCPIVFLTTRVMAPDVDDQAKLERVLKYLNGTRDFGICIEPDKDGIMSMHVYVDASFAVHAEYKSHTGIVVTFGGGGIYFRSTKQKLNTTSSTEAELVAVSDAMPSLVHVREFLIHQGYDMGPANLYQDNMSTIKLIENGRSNSDRTRHINIRFFFVKDRLDAGEINVQYMPTDDMIADILTKPLQGSKFRELRAQLLNWPQ